MRLLFLGTGPAVALPRPGHRDPLCTDARRGGKSRRRRSAAVVSGNAWTVLIDAGPDITEQLNSARPARLDAVLLTHAHADAAGGLRDLDRWVARHWPTSTIPVFTDGMTKRRLAARHPHLKNLHFVSTPSFQPLPLKKIVIRPFPVRHSLTPGFPTRGWLFGQTLAYASDVAALPPRSARLLKNLDTLVLDAAMYLGRTMPAHLSADAAIRLAARLRVRRLFLTQLGHSHPPHAEAESATRRFLRDLKVNRPASVALAHDGLVVRCPVPRFAAKQKSAMMKPYKS